MIIQGWSIDIINKIMNDQQDEFFVQPEIEEVHDIKLIQQANPIIDKPFEEPKSISLKMVQIPKPEENYVYRPFRFERRQTQEEVEESSNFSTNNFSSFTECYCSEQCVYQRYRNNKANQINETTYYSGIFLHRNVFLEGNLSDTFQIQNAAKLYYQQSNTPLPKGKPQDLIFDSHFQSANLFAAFKVSEFQYDLVMSNDANSTGNNQWFYFSVENMIVDKQYTFSVINFTKSDSLFNYGMAPAVYSMVQNKNVFGIEKSWRRQGKQVSYKRGILPRENSRRMYYKLTFKISTIFEKDKLYIAHSYPYSLEKLNKYIQDKANKYKQIVTKITVGKTLSKRVIEGLVIGQQLNKKRDNRKAIIVLARQHPGQTQGSYVCQGVMDRLFGKNKQAQFLLKNYIFYIIPMVNPDGVVFGHYRTNLAGKDLNRKWNATQKDLNCPEVTSIKSFILQISRQRQIRFILDLHGHSKKLNSFFYGNPCPQNPDVVRIYPYACSKLHSGIQYLDCTFSTQQYKKKAARVYLSFFYRLIHVYTFQSSFYAYFKDGKKIEFTPKEYRQLGGVLINALYLQLDHQVKYQQSFQFNLKKNTTKQFIGSPFVKMVAELKTNKELIEQGIKWQSGSQSKPQENEVNNQDIEDIKPIRPASTPSTQTITNSKMIKVSRKGNREPKQFSFNKPTRNLKFLQINKVNSILPDQYQLGLQPIRKKQTTIDIKPQFSLSKIGTAAQTQPKNELRTVQLKPSDIQSSLLSNSIKIENASQRKYSSVIKSNNRNIIFKFDVFGPTTVKQQQFLDQKLTFIQKHAYSQTLITYSKQQGQKIKASQVLPAVNTPQTQQRKWARNNSIRLQSSLKNGAKKDAQKFFDKMMKKLINEKQLMKSQQFSTKFILEKPLSIKKKEISKK